MENGDKFIFREWLFSLFLPVDVLVEPQPHHKKSFCGKHFDNRALAFLPLMFPGITHQVSCIVC